MPCNLLFILMMMMIIIIIIRLFCFFVDCHATAQHQPLHVITTPPPWLRLLLIGLFAYCIGSHCPFASSTLHLLWKGICNEFLNAIFTVAPRILLQLFL
jgi:hypothetical protein